MSLRVRINPIACDAHGMCVELLPELFRFDDWSYPIVEIALVPDELERIAQIAADACPTLAIVIEESAGVGRQH
jgi:ferredoxin